MSTDLLIWCVAVPLLAILVGAGVSRGLQAITGKQFGDALTAITVVAAWWLGIVISHGSRQSWELWPEEAWRRILIPLGVGSLLLAGLHNATGSWRQLRWPIACLAIGACVFVTTPAGSGWEDIMPLFRLWIPLAIISGFVNLWSLSELVDREGYRWAGLVAVSGVAASMIYAVGIYAGLAELIAASLLATLAASLLAIFQRFAAASAVIYPAAIFASSATWAGRCYSYEPPNVYAITAILFLPSLIAAVDRILPRNWHWRRTISSALIAAISLGILAWFLNPEADAEQW